MLLIFLDTNCINAKSQNHYLNELEALEEKGKIIIEKTDVMDTEMSEGKYLKGLKKSIKYTESLGPMVLGHSRFGHSVWGTASDDSRLTEILECVFGKKPRGKYSKQEIRDAMHLQNAGRSGGTYFVTDDKKILNKGTEIRSISGGILPCSPKECLETVKKRLRVGY